MTTASTASIPGTPFKDTALSVPTVSTSATTLPPSGSGNASLTQSGPGQEQGKKAKIPPNLAISPKLKSLDKRSASFRVAAQPSPKSPRKLKEASILTSSSSSSQSTPNPVTQKPTASSSILKETTIDAPLPSSNPVMRIIKAEVQISSELLKKLEREYIDHQIINFFLDDIWSSPVLLNDRHKIGRADTGFYIDRLPDVLQSYAKGINQTTISSSKLLQKIFYEDFRINMGWAAAKTLYANGMFKEKSQSGSALGENDPLVKAAAREKMLGMLEVIAREIFGHPVSLKNSPLPRRLIDVLVYADQRFHEKLLTEKSTKDWTTEQIGDARRSLIKLLTVTRLLMPMLTGLAEKIPSQNEIWCLGLAMQVFLKSATALSKEIFSESFATSSSSLQILAKDKEKYERIQARTHDLKTKAKKTIKHVRSRSADTQPVDINWLTRRDEMRAKRAQEKKETATGLAIARTNQVLSEVDFDDDAYAKAIAEGSRALNETEQVRKADSDLRDFNLEELELIQRMLDERDLQDIFSQLADGPLIPERAQPLPESTADLLPDVSSAPSGLIEVSTGDAPATRAVPTKAEPQAKDGVFQ